LNSIAGAELAPLLARLLARGVTLKADGADLVIVGPKELLTDDLVASIRRRKAALLSVLANPLSNAEAILRELPSPKRRAHWRWWFGGRVFWLRVWNSQTLDGARLQGVFELVGLVSRELRNEVVLKRSIHK
jgi:hypothetical protein